MIETTDAEQIERLNRRIAELLAEVAALKIHAQCAWRPIETVPKDHEVEVRGLWKLRGDGVEFTHWRPALTLHDGKQP